VLFGVMRDKDWQAMLRSLSGLASEIVLTRPRQPRSADPVEMAAAVRVPVRVQPDPLEAYRHIVETSAAGDVVLVTGSLFLIGDVLPAVAPDLASEAERERRAARLAGR
jgi:dihydrofolate synthase/folylpolyglutamate synthase